MPRGADFKAENSLSRKSRWFTYRRCWRLSRPQQHGSSSVAKVSTSKYWKENHRVLYCRDIAAAAGWHAALLCSCPTFSQSFVVVLGCVDETSVCCVYEKDTIHSLEGIWRKFKDNPDHAHPPDGKDIQRSHQKLLVWLSQNVKSWESFVNNDYRDHAS